MLSNHRSLSCIHTLCSYLLQAPQGIHSTMYYYYFIPSDLSKSTLPSLISMRRRPPCVVYTCHRVAAPRFTASSHQKGGDPHTSRLTWPIHNTCRLDICTCRLGISMLTTYTPHRPPSVHTTTVRLTNTDLLPLQNMFWVSGHWRQLAALHQDGTSYVHLYALCYSSFLCILGRIEPG